MSDLATDLVVVSLERWDEVWRRNQHLLAGLLAAEPLLRVLLVEPPLDVLHDVRRRTVPRPGPLLRRIGPAEGGPAEGGPAEGFPAEGGPADGGSQLPGTADATARAGAPGGRLWAMRPRKWWPRRLDPAGDTRRARQVHAVATRLGLREPVLWVNDPAGAAVLRVTGWPALYDVTDDWLHAARTPRQRDAVLTDERELLRRCAEVVVCSPALARTKGATRPVTLVPNAVDVAAYRTPAPRPAGMPAGPCAVYVGTLHTDRADVDLCVELAGRLAGVGATLVLVGPALLPAADLTRLVRAGAHLTGARPAAEVPAYLQHADVLVVPHVVDDFTASLDPLKLYEYLAVGRRVVSTPVAGFRDQARGLVQVADRTGFTAAVLTALASPAPAPDHTVDVPDWGSRVAAMRLALRRVAASRAAPTRA